MFERYEAIARKECKHKPEGYINVNQEDIRLVYNSFKKIFRLEFKLIKHEISYYKACNEISKLHESLHFDRFSYNQFESIRLEAYSKVKESMLCE